MKKMFTLVTAAFLLLSTSAFATGPIDVNAAVKTAFKKDFSKAKSVSWKTADNFYFAHFSVNDVLFNAVYNEAGDLLATSRIIGLKDLPIAVQQALQENYGDYSFGAPVTELNFDHETNYYLAVSDGKKVLHLKISAGGTVSVESSNKT